MEKKKILFTANDLRIGGIEKALVTLLNYLIEENYDITLVLERKKGELLKKLDYRIKVEEYTPSDNKIIIFRKFINFIKRLIAINKYKNKFDTSVSFATYSLPGSFIARTASRNSILWGHANYLDLFQGDRDETQRFFEKLGYNEFKKVVFVSKEGRNTFIDLFPKMKEKTFNCNNLIDADEIERLSKEKIDIKKEEIYTFLNVGRHDERQKKLSRIIRAAEKLKKENYKFRILFVGDGQDTNFYKELVNESDLKKEILFLGRKENPYPYFNISDCIILSSDYEGYPVVFLESFILNRPIITTNVSDFDEVQCGRGIVCDKSINGIYNSMKKMISEGYKLENRFEQEKYNKEIKIKIKKILE